MKTIAILADVSNLYYCINRKFEGRKLDYKKYRKFIADLGEIETAIAYGSQMKAEAHKFITCLKGVGFTPKFKHPKEMGWAARYKRKSDWDVGIAIDMIRHAPDVDIVVLGSADSDMAYAVDYIRANMKTQIVVIACGVSSELHKSAHAVIEVTESMLEGVK